MPEKLFISTSIPYVNAAPHIGHALEFVQGDVLARYYREKGFDVFFLTGTDENSLKNVLAAEKRGIDVKVHVKENSDIFEKLTKVLDISNDDFIRTTEERHIAGAQKLWNACDKAGDIYKKKYEGLYCVGCESFYTEKDLVNGLCPEHQTKPEVVKEENYFLKLGKYQDKLKKLIENDELKITPASRKNETLEFINKGLEDLSISRSQARAHGWGIPVPGDSSQVEYVWFDALSNYINVIGYANDEKRFQDWWVNNKRKIHLVGKGIARFHTVYWPIMLLSAGLPLPSEIIVHGYFTINGQKISKSIGNVIDPFSVVKKYGVDPTRYFLLREIPSGKDGDFSYERLEARYNGDLANNLGNLVSRVAKLIETNLEGELIFNPEFLDKEAEKRIEAAKQKYEKAVEEFQLHTALSHIWELLDYANVYIDGKKPWVDAKESPEKFLKTITTSTTIILESAKLLKPFLPETFEKIYKTFGFEPGVGAKEDKIIISEIKPLFPKLQ
ncbi:MAG: methionyl-tRNA synthetase [Parcubacteria group bacterium Licking1014_17]|nr:MAG: methionyl-tRNA synthetase [Parcubacteria group bacterium Licking1014_17]